MSPPDMADIADIDLSICIPTYNRSQSVAPLVRKILASSATRFEVVVLDNGSEDDTVERLAALGDDRLSLNSNGANRGVLFNILNVLEKARGRHAVLLLDKDNIDGEGIDAFRVFLMSAPELACGYCTYPSDKHPGSTTFARGPEALGKVGYLGHHPTGYFFNMRQLRSIRYLERFANFSAVGHFPFDFAFAELALMGNAAVYDEPLFEPETLGDAARYRSIGTNASKEDAFFSPRGRLLTAIQYAGHARTLPIDARHKQTLVAERFFRGMLDATVGYRRVMSNEALCTHYHVPQRRVSAAELLAIGLDFWRTFVARCVLEENDLRLRAFLRFHAEVAAALGARVRRRLKAALG